jgi:hypothetical protein
MKLFKCQACGHLLYFENTRCERCRHRLGYLPEAATISALEEAEGGGWHALAAPRERFRSCANAAHETCNWLVPADSGAAFCAACRHNHTIPDLSLPANLQSWRKLEIAKHRLFYGLLRLGLPLADRIEDPRHGLVFDFVAPTPAASAPAAMTGHEDGVITIALTEADDGERERLRSAMGEPYRTLLGHFRHEVGHHFWDVLVRDGGRLGEFRAVFGDEQADYAAALQQHYGAGAPPDWRESFVTAYASAHPWEDFAETWAHYLHIVDTLEMASAFGLSVQPALADEPGHAAQVDFDPYGPVDAETLVQAWLPLTFAVNSLNRAMGQPDLYPFLLTPVVQRKLACIHSLVHAGTGRAA